MRGERQMNEVICLSAESETSSLLSAKDLQDRKREAGQQTREEGTSPVCTRIKAPQ
jgi:hypothetical protein